VTTLNFGIEHTEEDIDTVATVPARAIVASEDNTSYTTELLYTPTERLDLSLALRHDDNSTFGGETTGRATALYRASDSLSVRATVGTGYRAPSLYERFSAFGDRTLDPETSVSYELGVEKTIGDRGIVKATLFHTDVDDLIEFDGAATACASGIGCFNQVPGTTTSRGLELSGEYALSDAVSIYGAYTYTDAETNGQRLTRTPRHDAVLGLSGDFNSGVSGHLDIRHVADVVPSPFAPANNKVGDYTLVGAGVGYDLTETAEVYLRVENLLDEDYETAGGFNQPGRSAYFGFRATF
jgi:vitamin B12 transporter